MRNESSPSGLNGPSFVQDGTVETKIWCPAGITVVKDRPPARPPVSSRFGFKLFENSLVQRVAPCCWLAQEERHSLFANGFMRTLKGRETLFASGDECRYVYIVVSGLLKTYRSTSDGRSQIVGLTLPGDMAGSLFHERQLLSADAIGTTRVFQLSRSSLQDLLNRRSDLKDRFVRLVYDGLANAYDHMLLLGRMRSTERVSSLLFQLMERAQLTGESTTPLFLTMRRQDMADFLGLSLETVSRGFTQLVKKGIIELRAPDKVFIRDRSRLKQIAHID